MLARRLLPLPLHARHAEYSVIASADDEPARPSPRLLAALRTLAFPRRPLLVFDDIRVWNMVAVWRAIPWPKLNLTSFGHWTGTGLVDVSGAAVAGDQRAG